MTRTKIKIYKNRASLEELWKEKPMFLCPTNTNDPLGKKADAFKHMLSYVGAQVRIDRNTDHQLRYIAQVLEKNKGLSWWGRIKARKQLEACVLNLRTIADNLYMKSERDHNFLEDFKND